MDQQDELESASDEVCEKWRAGDRGDSILPGAQNRDVFGCKCFTRYREAVIPSTDR